jgi:hypothetical protein
MNSNIRIYFLDKIVKIQLKVETRGTKSSMRADTSLPTF